MEDAAYYRAKAQQCRRLLLGINDKQAQAGLAELAEEFEAKAQAAEAGAPPTELPGQIWDDYRSR